MDLVRLVEGKILSVVEAVVKLLEGEAAYFSFESQLKKELDGLGLDLLRVVLEALDQQLQASEERKQTWTIVRTKDRKEILTPFGLLVYERNYYRHKESKRYAYLVDEKVGIKPHSRIGASLKGDLVQSCVDMSYEESTVQASRHNAELKVSRQTVAACVQEFQAKALLLPEQKRRVSTLYVEADEDHVKVKGRKGVQARLIYIHEGVVDYPRRHLKNARYFTTVAKSPLEFWFEVCDYISAYYDFENLEAIYLSGDGSSWIRVGTECIPGATFILDKFHLAKYIMSATAHAPELKRPIYRGIFSLNKQAVLNTLHEALKRAEGASRQKRIHEAIKYIDNNWDGIEGAVKHPHVRCSAESHVSHVLSARLSSRPMAWSLKGSENMAAMRAVKANGESVKEHYLASRTSAAPIVELKVIVQKELKRLRQTSLLGKEYLNNVPLFSGVDNLTRRALKGLNSYAVI
jgi:hypothetical protein